MPKVKTPQFSSGPEISKALPSIFDRYGETLSLELRSALHNKDNQVEEPLRYHMGWSGESGEQLTTPEGQGKVLRPTLCLFACEALGGEWRSALPVAVALELIHNFSLVHDDIQDGDTERRHRRTVWVVWGQPKAIIAGVGMHCLAYLTARSLAHDFPSETKVIRASRLLVESSLAMIEGQCRDLHFEQKLDIGLNEYLDMVRLKTGALIQCSLEAGALMATDKSSYIAAFSLYGSHLGRLFQIRDDILGIWGIQKETGKPSGNDIHRRKKSFPIVFALERSSLAHRDRLMHLYKKESFIDSDIEEVLDILDKSGARKHAHKIITQEARLALGQLDGVPLSATIRRDAQELLDFLIVRNF